MIEVKTILNENLMRKFNADEAKSKLWLPFILTALFVVLGIVGKITGFLDMFLAVFIVIIGLCLPIIFILTTRLLMNKMLKTSPALNNGITQTWRFLEDEIIFNETGKYVEAHDTHVKYEAVYKVKESDGAFYLYLNKMQAYILDAKGITMGSRRDLHDFLIDKLGSKRVKFPKRIYAKK